jgi:D-aminopeptidase
VEEGAVGADAGAVAFGFKGGIGTASRKTGGYTVGVLVKPNFGGTLAMNGAPVGREMAASCPNSGNGSMMMIVAADAPVDSHNLRRMAARTMFGLARTGSSGSNGSGDFRHCFHYVADSRQVAEQRCSWLLSRLRRRLLQFAAARGYGDW